MRFKIETASLRGHYGGKVDSILAFYSNDTSSNPAGVWIFCTAVRKDEKIFKKEARVGPLKKI